MDPLSPGRHPLAALAVSWVRTRSAGPGASAAGSVNVGTPADREGDRNTVRRPPASGSPQYTVTAKSLGPLTILWFKCSVCQGTFLEGEMPFQSPPGHGFLQSTPDSTPAECW